MGAVPVQRRPLPDGNLGAMAQPRPSSIDPFATPYLDPAHVAWVVTLPDFLERNAAITHGYHALSEAVAAVLGRGHANWLTFGQWASAEARASISGEAVPGPLRRFLAEDVARAVAGGNAAIFGDVAPPFIRFVELYRGAEVIPAGDPERATRRRALLEDPAVARTPDLAMAFAAYADAADLLATTVLDEVAFAGRMFVGNVGVGAHEQCLADPFVRAAIPGRWLSAVLATSDMRLLLPERELALNRDVPPPAYLGGDLFPVALRTLRDPDAIDLARRFGQDLDDAARSDAPDWESFDERMGFIFTLFRAYQCDPTLYPLPPATPPPPERGRD